MATHQGRDNSCRGSDNRNLRVEGSPCEEKGRLSVRWHTELCLSTHPASNTATSLLNSFSLLTQALEVLPTLPRSERCCKRLNNTEHGADMLLLGKTSCARIQGERDRDFRPFEA